VTNDAAVPAPLPGDAAKMWVLGGGWSPDGRYIAVSDGNQFGVLTLASGHFAPVAHAPGPVGSVKGGASWAGGPRRVVFALSTPNGAGHRVFAADFDGGNGKQIWAAPTGDVPDRGDITSIGPPNVSPSGQQIFVRASRTQHLRGKLIFLHETWLLRLDGSANQLFIPDSFNAVWRPKTRFASANPVFYNTWRLADNAVAAGQVARPWLWGPKPITSTVEPWTDAPGGTRVVEYYDKGRMEIANPALTRPNKYFVSAGLLAKELVTGQVQTGPLTYTVQAPAAVVVAGDGMNNPAPTYATFNKLGAATDAGKTGDHTGQPVSTTLSLDGTTGADAGLAAGVHFAHFVAESGHNIPDAFWTWLQKQADWVALMGYPVSEPYWVHATVGGRPDQAILVQIYERRTLTFTPAHPAPWRVELGNVGQQYLAWRYGTR